MAMEYRFLENEEGIRW